MKLMKHIYPVIKLIFITNNKFTVMKKYFLFIALLSTTLFAEMLKKDVHIYFNPAKLTTELKGNSTLFKYNDKNCKFVVHEPGSPVMPCLPVYVLVPKGAMFRSCTVRAEIQPLCGNFKLHCRRYVAETAFTARRYPPKLAEFVGYKEINGYRTFEFRTYPITCQPGDNSVNKILQASLSIKYDVPENNGFYDRFSSEAFDKIKRIVVNPNDLTRLSSSNYVKSSLRRKSILNARDPLAQETFATKIEKNVSDKKPDIALTPKRSPLDELIGDKLSIDNDGIAYTPITF